MKKLLLPILILTATCWSMQTLTAQTDFQLRQTSYIGALGADPANDWTTGWTNWDPKTTAYPAPTDNTTLNGMSSSLPTPGELNITTTVTLDPAKVYMLAGFIVVRSGGKLVIPAGTVIRCLADLNSTPANYASIIVERGGQIEILGTQENPVILTSAKAAGERERGDWGGLLIAGRSYHNLLNGTDNNNVQMEGFNNVSFDATLARFGGTDPLDNSGIIRYLRVEFGGLAFEINKEINGVTFGGVGSATEVNHIQVSYSNDDSFEWFGGTMNASHLIAWKGTDDDFDTDNGFRGLVQFGIGVRDYNYFDGTYNAPSGSSTSEGFESDNEASGTAAVTPVTSPIFSNFTMVGPIPVGSNWADMDAVTKAAFRRGARIRRNSSERIVNSIFMGYRNFLMIDGDSCVRNTNFPAALALVTPSTPVNVDAKQLFYTNNIIVNTASAYTSATDTTANGLVEVARAAGSANKLAALTNWVNAAGPLANKVNPVTFTAGTLLVNPVAASTTPDFKPVNGSPALSGANFLDNPVLVNITTDSREISQAIQFAPIYPNPASAGSTLNFGREVVSYGIFTVEGRLVQYGLDTDHADLKQLTPGVYFIKLDGSAQKLIVK